MQKGQHRIIYSDRRYNFKVFLNVYKLDRDFIFGGIEFHNEIAVNDKDFMP